MSIGTLTAELRTGVATVLKVPTLTWNMPPFPNTPSTPHFSSSNILTLDLRLLLQFFLYFIMLINDMLESKITPGRYLTHFCLLLWLSAGALHMGWSVGSKVIVMP